MSDESLRIAAATGSQLNGRSIARRLTSARARSLGVSDSIQDTLETNDRETDSSRVVQKKSDKERRLETDQSSDSNDPGSVLDITG